MQIETSLAKYNARSAEFVGEFVLDQKQSDAIQLLLGIQKMNADAWEIPRNLYPEIERVVQGQFHFGDCDGFFEQHAV